MEKCTPRQAEILSLIRDKITLEGRPPTRAEIARAFGFRSINAVETHLRALVRKGALELHPGTARGIRLKNYAPAGNTGGLPLIGHVAAGSPLLAQEHIEDYYQLDPNLFRPQADYLLRVYGESMTGVGIMHGDLIAVHRTQEIRDGQITVVRIDDEVTIKRLYRSGAVARLVAENPAFSTMQVDVRAHSLSVEGLAVGIVRNGIS